jgi:hypothetical protein
MVTCRIDTKNWMAAKNVLLAHSKTNPSQSLAKSVAFVVKDAKNNNNTPATSIARIDSDMGAIASPAVLKSGKLSRDKKRQLETIGINLDSAAARIVLARLNPNSKYNWLTDGKYALNRATFSPGLGQAGFIARVLEAGTRMIKSRRSSTGFLAITWNGILDALIDYVPASYKSTVSNWSAYNRKSKPIFGIGDARMAGQGTVRCQLTISNFLGESGLYPNLDAKRNEAAHAILGPVLQSSIDRNFVRQMEIAVKNGYDEIRPLIKSLGFH